METTLITEAMKVWGVPGGVLVFVFIMAYRQISSGAGGDGRKDMQNMAEHVKVLLDHIEDMRGDITPIKEDIAALRRDIAVILDRSQR